jgi:GT2 family glycosyltransferase
MSATVAVVIPTLGPFERATSLATALRTTNRTVAEVAIVVTGAAERPHTVTTTAGTTILPVQERLPVSMARNLGANAVSSELILFIDDDNSAQPSMVDRLSDFMEAHKSCVAVGPWQYLQDDRGKLACAGAIHPRVGPTRMLRPRLAPSERADGRVSRCSSIPNAFMVRRSQFLAVAGFDAGSFPMDFEESDLQQRLVVRFGGFIACVGSASVYHDIRPSRWEQLMPKSRGRAYTTGRNRTVFLARHFGLFSALASFVVVQLPVSAATLVAILSSHSSVREKWTLIVAHLSGVGAGLTAGLQQRRVRSAILGDGLPRGGQPDAVWLRKWQAS